MTAAVEQESHTLLPPTPDTSRQYKELSKLLAAAPQKPSKRARLVSPEGEEIELPDELFGVLREVVQALSSGQGISIAPHTAQLSTQEAADFLGISRPTLVKLLEQGEIPFEQSGRRRHRKVRLADVESYRRRARRSRRTALRTMTQEADEAGLYETDTGFVSTR